MNQEIFARKSKNSMNENLTLRHESRVASVRREGLAEVVDGVTSDGRAGWPRAWIRAMAAAMTLTIILALAAVVAVSLKIHHSQAPVSCPWCGALQSRSARRCAVCGGAMGRASRV